jgi:hypothetical protein
MLGQLLGLVFVRYVSTTSPNFTSATSATSERSLFYLIFLSSRKWTPRALSEPDLLLLPEQRELLFLYLLAS